MCSSWYTKIGVIVARVRGCGSSSKGRWCGITQNRAAQVRQKAETACFRKKWAKLSLDPAHCSWEGVWRRNGRCRHTHASGTPPHTHAEVNSHPNTHFSTPAFHNSTNTQTPYLNCSHQREQRERKKLYPSLSHYFLLC
jgi:hypothetical protein